MGPSTTLTNAKKSGYFKSLIEVGPRLSVALSLAFSSFGHPVDALMVALEQKHAQAAGKLSRAPA